MDNHLKSFSLQFFKELGANVLESGDFIEVTSVPVKFQKFYGKNEPYKIVFDKSLSVLGTELVTAESYLLKMMKAYLDNSGDAVLVNLNYRLNVDSLIKDNLELKNCFLVKASSNLTNNSLFKFTFQTTYKYLNEEEKIINDVYVDNGQVKTPDLSKFTINDLNKKNIDMSQLRDYYSIAKDNVKFLINKKTSFIANKLDSSLSKEVERIKTYNQQQIKEIDLQIAKSGVGSKSRLDSTELEKQKVQNAREMELFIQNEEKKHALKLNTKLITTAIMTYPVYSVESFFKAENVTRLAIIKFDPLNNKLDLPICDLCHKNLNEVIICNGSHLVCRDCGVRCGDCGEISCVLCLKQICSITKRKICKQCGKTCSRCKSFKNKRFMTVDSIGRNFTCKNCY